MPSIVIRLDPEKLQNPDLDLRYLIPDRLAELSGGLVSDDGYDYEPQGNAMQIYLQTQDLALAVPQVVTFLETENMLGNCLARAAEVGTSDKNACDTKEFGIVYPHAGSGVIRCPT
ncbi:MAG TPA: hypothetical protein VIV60_17770 [Polyangiaceae bacterium]